MLHFLEKEGRITATLGGLQQLGAPTPDL